MKKSFLLKVLIVIFALVNIGLLIGKNTVSIASANDSLISQEKKVVFPTYRSTINTKTRLKGLKASNISTNSANVNGINYSILLQNVPQNKEIKFTWDGNPDASVYDYGCGPTTIINVLSGYGRTKSQEQIRGINFDSSINGLASLMSSWGLSYSYSGAWDETKAVEAMKRGIPIILRVAGGNSWISNNGDHYVAILGIDDKEQLVLANSWSVRWFLWWNMG